MTTAVRQSSGTTIVPLTYTNSFSANVGTTVSNGNVIFTPAANVNGAYLELASWGGNGATAGYLDVSVAAKTTATTSIIDGDVLFNASSALAVTQSIRIKIAAGKGLYWSTSESSGPSTLSVLYTLL